MHISLQVNLVESPANLEAGSEQAEPEQSDDVQHQQEVCAVSCHLESPQQQSRAHRNLCVSAGQPCRAHCPSASMDPVSFLCCKPAWRRLHFMMITHEQPLSWLATQQQQQSKPVTDMLDDLLDLGSEDVSEPSAPGLDISGMQQSPLESFGLHARAIMASS